MSKISNLKAYYNENMSWMWNFIMAESGAIFTFGKSRFGDNLPNKFWVRGDKAKSVACGDEHTALVTGKCVSIDTFIRGNFISRLTWDELVCVDHFFHDQALSTPFFKISTTGIWQRLVWCEQYLTMRFLGTSQNSLTKVSILSDINSHC